MSPIDFTSGPHATVDIYDGTTPKLRLTADDPSCRWNGFPVYLFACDYTPSAVSSTYQSFQFTDPLTLTPSSASTETDWPSMYLYDIVAAITAGQRLQIRVRGDSSTPGTFGNIGVTNAATGLCFGDNTPIGGGAYDSGWQDCYPTCLQLEALGDAFLKIHPFLSNGSPFVGWAFQGYRIETQYTAAVDPPMTYDPYQVFDIEWEPPCPLNSEGFLAIGLEVDGCGNLTKTYTQVKDAINALSLGVTATVLGGHGSEIAQPDMTCAGTPTWDHECLNGTQSEFACLMGGAHCSGAVDTDEGN